MSKNVRKKALPGFQNGEEERAFWAAQDSTAYIDWSKGERIALPNLKPSLKTISLRLPQATVAELKMLANKRDVPTMVIVRPDTLSSSAFASRASIMRRCPGGPVHGERSRSLRRASRQGAGGQEDYAPSPMKIVLSDRASHHPSLRAEKCYEALRSLTLIA